MNRLTLYLALLGIPLVLAFILATIAHAEVPAIYVSPALNATNFAQLPFGCNTGYGPQHLAHYEDRANNTIDIWCMWLPSGGESTTTPDSRSFVIFYNGGTVIGMCPYQYGHNSYRFYTDENGLINETYWLSQAPSGRSTEYHMTFNQYNATEAGVIDRAGIWFLFDYGIGA